jgi:hypothetical protein
LCKRGRAVWVKRPHAHARSAATVRTHASVWVHPTVNPFHTNQSLHMSPYRRRSPSHHKSPFRCVIPIRPRKKLRNRRMVQDRHFLRFQLVSKETPHMKDTVPQLPMMPLVSNRRMQAVREFAIVMTTTVSSMLGTAVASSTLTTVRRSLYPRALAVRTW